MTSNNQQQIQQQLRSRLDQQREKLLQLDRDQQNSPDPEPPKSSPDEEKNRTILGMLGVEQYMVGTISRDLKQLIKKDNRVAIDGYVLAMSRIMKHAAAWDCLVKAFTESGETVPQKFQSMFGKSESQIKMFQKMKVE